MRRHRLLGHLAVRYFAICLMALMVYGWVAAQAFDTALTRSTWTELEAAANLAASEATDALAAQNQTAALEIAQRIGQNTRTRITLISPTGAVLADSRDEAGKMENHADRPEVAAALVGRPGRDTRYSATRNEQMQYAAAPIRQEGKRIGVARAARSMAEIQQVYHESLGVLLVGIALVGLAAAALGIWLASRTSRQVQVLEHGAQLLADGQRMPKLSLPEIEEFASLATALNKVSQQLEERSQRIGRQGHEQETVLASMIEGVLAVDSDERLITLNSAAAELIGSKQTDLQGKNLQEVIRNAELRRFVARALGSADPIEDDVVLHGQRQRILRVRGTALHDGADRSVGAVIVLNDVTHYRRLENLRRDFVANVSHELKTPIASIKGFVETLLDGALSQPHDAERFLKIIGSHADRLNSIIEDLLSLSKIEQSEEAANLPVYSTPLAPVLDAALHGCQNQAEQRQIRLSLDCGELVAPVNPPLLEQAIINLIDNAIKYSEPGKEVVVSARTEGPEIAIAIRDHGCGIAAEHLPRLFERFYRVDRARSRKLGGTGLGLAIVKHIVLAHHGRITVTSEPGEGSEFCIFLPATTDTTVNGRMASEAGGGQQVAGEKAVSTAETAAAGPG